MLDKLIREVSNETGMEHLIMTINIFNTKVFEYLNTRGISKWVEAWVWSASDGKRIDI